MQSKFLRNITFLSLVGVWAGSLPASAADYLCHYFNNEDCVTNGHESTLRLMNVKSLDDAVFQCAERGLNERNVRGVVLMFDSSWRTKYLKKPISGETSCYPVFIEPN